MSDCIYIGVYTIEAKICITPHRCTPNLNMISAGPVYSESVQITDNLEAKGTKTLSPIPSVLLQRHATSCFHSRYVRIVVYRAIWSDHEKLQTPEMQWTSSTSSPFAIEAVPVL
ncbi:hypothetical protein ABKN59_008733 [Abortiporus biennis]